MIDRLNDLLGRVCAWLTLGMVLGTFLVVVLRYFFGMGFTWLQEIPLYLHATLFLAAAGYALQNDLHVRVDIFYRPMSPRKKAWVDLMGSLFLLLPTVALIFYQAWPYVVSSWEVFEASQDSGGLPLVFVLKSMILVYCVALALQAVSLSMKSLREIRS